MSEFYDIFRDVNLVLPLVASAVLVVRVIIAWPAEWAKPAHVVHYRALLLLLLAYVMLSSVVFWWFEAKHVGASPISPAYTLQTCGVLLLCWRWPKRLGNGAM